MIAYAVYLCYQLVLTYKVSQSCTANSNTHHGINTKYYECLEAKTNLTCYYKFYPLVEMIGKIISLTQIYEWVNVTIIMFWQQPGKGLTETLLELKSNCFFVESRRREQAYVALSLMIMATYGLGMLSVVDKVAIFVQKLIIYGMIVGGLIYSYKGLALKIQQAHPHQQ